MSVACKECERVGEEGCVLDTATHEVSLHFSALQTAVLLQPAVQADGQVTSSSLRATLLELSVQQQELDRKVYISHQGIKEDWRPSWNWFEDEQQIQWQRRPDATLRWGARR